MSDPDEIIDIDGDTCTSIELNKLFDHSLRLSNEKAVSLRNDYILHMDASCDFSTVAATTSDKIHFFKLDNRNGFTQIGEHSFAPINASHDKSVCGVRFWNENPNMITIGEENGNIATYDLRAPNKIVNFENDGQNRLTCFDLNVNDKILCAGCQQNNIGGVPILFYDIRMSKMQHSYVDSHQDDVTTVKFHPVQSNSIATGSTDGLINIFDINEREEDDAMTSCLNTESSVQSITWHPKSGTEFYLTCITHTNDLHLFDTETEDLVIRRDRNEITEAIKRKLVGDCYLIDCYTDSVEEIFILAGSNYNNGECLRSLTLKDKILNRRNNFIENKQIVRCSSFNPKDNVLITAGEGGIISVWDSRGGPNVENSTKLKDQKKKYRKSKPY